MDRHRPATKPRQHTFRILVIRHRYVGDLVLSSPVMRNLRLHFPDAFLSLLTDARYRDVHAANPDIDEVLAIPQSGQNPLVAAGRWLRLLWQIKMRRYDLVIDLTSTGKTARLALWSGARTVSGFETKAYKRSGQRRIILSSRTGKVLENCHISDLYLKPLEALEIPIATREVSLTVDSDEARIAQQQVCGVLGEKDLKNSFLVMVHPGARLATRRWPAEKYAAVCDALQQGDACRVLLLAGPGEEDIVRAIKAHMKTEVAALDAPASVPALAATFVCADLLLCNDSGPMHVAAAVGTPIVALFGAQSTSLWHPTSESVALQAPMPCTNCLFPAQCRPPDDYQMMCIARIEVQEVVEAVSRLKSRLNKKN